MNITFTHPAAEPDEHRGTDKETRYQAGESYDLPTDRARLWLARGCAYLSPKGTKAEAPEPTKVIADELHRPSGKPKLTLKTTEQASA